MRRGLLIWCALGALGLFTLGVTPALAGQPYHTRATLHCPGP